MNRRDVVVIGGGLTGLAAAWELEQLGVGYTLIEVRPRLGGSIQTLREAGYILDAGAFIVEKYGTWEWLDALGLGDALASVGVYRDGEIVLFRQGTGALIDALAARLKRGTILTRMAVSSVGRLETGRAGGERFGVCLENGLLLDAGALVVTAPARYAAHMLHGLSAEVGYRLADYRYDSIARISLGYRAEDVDVPDAPPDDYGITFWQWTTNPHRVPDGHVLVRAGVRTPVEGVADDGLALALAATLRFPLNPAVARVDYWAEADPLTRHLPEHADNMDAIERLLPARVALAGSDYRAKRLDLQIADGRAAARRVVEALRA